MTAAEQQISPVAWTADRDAEWRTALRHASLVAEVEIADEDLDQAIGYFGRFLWNKTPAQFRRFGGSGVNGGDRRHVLQRRGHAGRTQRASTG